MKKCNLRELKSIKEFKDSIDRTHVFIHSLESTIVATEAFLDFTKAKADPNYKKFEKFFEFDEAKKSYLFELGFIALFANFEFFMYSLLREIFLKYPGSYKSERILCFEEISDFKKVKEIEEYFVDIFAVEKSYDIKTWSSFLENKFNIKFFKDEKHFKRFSALNSMRNPYMHSGGVTNSKFRKEMKSFLKTKVPLGEKLGFNRREYFEILYRELNLIINIAK